MKIYGVSSVKVKVIATSKLLGSMTIFIEPVEEKYTWVDKIITPWIAVGQWSL